MKNSRISSSFSPLNKNLPENPLCFLKLISRFTPEKTLTRLKTLSNKTILLKPHGFTDISHLKEVVKKFSKNKYIIVELHPLILSYISKVFISNFFSILYNDAHIFNTPVIEYTRYSDETLSLINNGPIYPEYVTHFINNDSDYFSKTLKTISDEKYTENKFVSKESCDAINISSIFSKDKG